MQRRKFLKNSVLCLAMVPLALFSKDYRAAAPDAWKAKKVDEAIKLLYPEAKSFKRGDLSIKVPTVAASGASVPVRIRSGIDAKSVALFQDINPESAVAVWSIPENGIIDYALKLKLKQGDVTLTVVIEDKNGNYYRTDQKLVVAGGGCD